MQGSVMRHSHYCSSAQSTQAILIDWLTKLIPFEFYGRHLSAPLLARVMAWIALRQSTRHAAAERLALPVGKETLRKAMVAATPTVADALQLIRQSIPPPLLKYFRKRKRGIRIAIDLHHQPYYGQAVSGTHWAKAKQGTKQFWSVATAVVVHQGERVTLAVVPVTSNRMEMVLEALWAWIQRFSIKISCLLLDRGFYGGPVIGWLREHQIRYIMPMIKRGNLGRGTGTVKFFRRGQVGFRTYRWRERHRKAWVETGVAIVAHPHDRRRRPYVFAIGGRFASLDQCYRWYKSRFGIESSYREAKAIRGWTTSHDANWRRFLQILSFVIRNLWIGIAWWSTNSHNSITPLRLQQIIDLFIHLLNLPIRIVTFSLTPT